MIAGLLASDPRPIRHHGVDDSVLDASRECVGTGDSSGKSAAVSLRVPQAAYGQFARPAATACPSRAVNRPHSPMPPPPAAARVNRHSTAVLVGPRHAFRGLGPRPATACPHRGPHRRALHSSGLQANDPYAAELQGKLLRSSGRRWLPSILFVHVLLHLTLCSGTFISSEAMGRLQAGSHRGI